MLDCEIKISLGTHEIVSLTGWWALLVWTAFWLTMGFGVTVTIGRIVTWLWAVTPW